MTRSIVVAVDTNLLVYAHRTDAPFHAAARALVESLSRAPALAARIQGGAIHDARIAAICLYHGVTELWSADRDFSRYPALPTRNPLAG